MQNSQNYSTKDIKGGKETRRGGVNRAKSDSLQRACEFLLEKKKAPCAGVAMRCARFFHARKSKRFRAPKKAEVGEFLTRA